jgi:hypothetical protein
MLVKLLGDDTYVRSNLLCIFMPRCLFTYLYIPDNEQTILNVEEDYINILLLFVQIQVAHAVAIKRQYANIWSMTHIPCSHGGLTNYSEK